MIYIASIIIPYLVLIRLLRYQRRNQISQKYGDGQNRQQLAAMTLGEASRIQRQLAELEFPRTFQRSLGFAILKTYGIPSISRLLVATSQLSADATVSKRATDTGVIMSEIIYNDPSSDRCIDGISRMNYLHKRYRKAGKILDNDMLYTLSLFALEPIRWINRFEWRTLTDAERCAIGVFWKDMGDMMGITYTKLQPYLAKSAYHDGLAWIEALNEWSLSYENENMKPEFSNKVLGDRTLKLVVTDTPGVFRGFALKLAASAIESHLRTALMIPEPGKGYVVIFNIINLFKKLFIQHLSPPRPKFARARLFTDDPDPSTGRYYRTQYLGYPWYVEPTVMARWGPRALWLRLIGGTVPGGKYNPEGYIISNIGPEAFKNKGEEEMKVSKEHIKRFRERSTCPMGRI
ncbi:hypothetical protein BX600DRAFT_391519 [Xylariales sp. PMI_506]|nr:hypothetical protein BX600DRAFT_391519 [Xylariales sp. PMI_506]